MGANGGRGKSHCTPKTLSNWLWRGGCQENSRTVCAATGRNIIPLGKLKLLVLMERLEDCDGELLPSFLLLFFPTHKNKDRYLRGSSLQLHL